MPDPPRRTGSSHNRPGRRHSTSSIPDWCSAGRYGRLSIVQRDQLLAGRYRLLERLGSGGMSEVHRAYDEVLERDVAVKVLAASDAGAGRRIRAEAKAAARLAHPNVTNVYDYGESELDGARVPFVVMELLRGRTLEQRLAAGPLPPPAGLRICAEVAAALAAAHAQGLVHRDVKPANVMLTPSGAKVLDFGIAAVAGEPEIDFEGRLLGTPAYLAPERLEAGEVLPACDVYALGLLVHRVLTGRLPWGAETQTGMLRANAHVEPDPLPEIAGVSAEIYRLYRWCLAKDPADRPPAAEAARVLAAAAAGEPATAPAGAATAPAGAATAPAGAATAPAGAATAPAGATGSTGAPAGTVAGSGGGPAPAAAGTPSDGAIDRAVLARPAALSSAAPSGPATAAAGQRATRQRSWRRRRAALAIGGAVFAAVAVAGSLGDLSNQRLGPVETPRTGLGSGRTTTVGLPVPAEPIEPVATASSRPPAAPPVTGLPAGSPTGPTSTQGPTPAATSPAPTPTGTGSAPTPTLSPTPGAGVPVDARGGTITVRCLGKSVEVLSVTPASGYHAAAYDAGPAKQIEVELTSADNRSAIRVLCANGRLVSQVKERKP
ncbi:protein kinase [Micromonospora sp. GCM10011542]|uniref:protein kinase domain-containing protein n=1 Tax=Micromonospora sp. GCM10011542 TaxID=3317337 RepID=UPI003624157C